VIFAVLERLDTPGYFSTYRRDSAGYTRFPGHFDLQIGFRREADTFLLSLYEKNAIQVSGIFPGGLKTTQGQFYIVKALDDLVQSNNLHYLTQSDRRVK
jgi:hypothetical protein